MRKLALLAMFSGCGTQEWRPAEGGELIGRPAPAWAAGKSWINSEPLTLESLRGRVVLVRFWLIDCPYCEATAPALNALHAKYSARGLVVLGFHHPKSPRARDPENVRTVVREYGFQFPVALDDDWEALTKYWFPNGEERRFTSVSFLIDRRGVIRWVHDGGEYRVDSPAYRSLETAVDRGLADK